jgi:hypothetical protein
VWCSRPEPAVCIYSDGKLRQIVECGEGTGFSQKSVLEKYLFSGSPPSPMFIFQVRKYLAVLSGNLSSLLSNEGNAMNKFSSVFSIKK